MAAPKRELQCCVCGAFAGKFHQHYNRDNGYGVCKKCVNIELAVSGIESVLSCYGVPGYHYAMPEVWAELLPLTLSQAHQVGVYAKKHGVPATFNPFKMPATLSRKLTPFDAYDDGYTGGSFENFANTSLRIH